MLNPTSSATPNNLNAASVVLRLNAGGQDVLLMGDAEQDVKGEVLVAHLLRRVALLKVGHLVSRSSSSPAFLQAVRPALAMVSAGWGNDYGHSHAETVTALADVPIKPSAPMPPARSWRAWLRKASWLWSSMPNRTPSRRRRSSPPPASPLLTQTALYR